MTPTGLEIAAQHPVISTAILLSLGDARGQDTKGGKMRVAAQTPSALPVQVWSPGSSWGPRWRATSLSVLPSSRSPEWLRSPDYRLTFPDASARSHGKSDWPPTLQPWR